MLLGHIYFDYKIHNPNINNKIKESRNRKQLYDLALSNAVHFFFSQKVGYFVNF